MSISLFRALSLCIIMQLQVSKITYSAICSSAKSLLVLDPRYKGRPFDTRIDIFPSDWVHTCRSRLINLLRKYDADAPQHSPPTTAPDAISSNSSSNLHFFLDPRIMGSTPITPSPSNITIEMELNKFLSEALYVPTTPDLSPLPWWKIHAKDYPRLAPLARNVLAIPGEFNSLIFLV